jgi:hypothetical protein
MNEEEIKRIAIAEIVSPKLGVTEQFFAVHEICDNDPIKYMEHDKYKHLVYFGIRDEPFYWVVKIEAMNGKLQATWGHCNPYSRVYLLTSA